MPQFFDPGTFFTAPQDFPKSVSEFFFFGYAAPNKFNKYHRRILKNVKYNTQIALFNQMGPVVGKARGCSPTPQGSSFATASQKVWMPKPTGINLFQCYEDFKGTIFAPFIKTVSRAPFQYDLNESPEMLRFLGSLFTPEYWNNENWRLYWLSNPSFTAANFPNAPGGAAATADMYNNIDGMWSRITTAGPLGGQDLSSGAPLLTAANAGADWATQKALMTPAAAVEALRALYNGCSFELRNDPNKVIFVTEWVWLMYSDYLANVLPALPAAATSAAHEFSQVGNGDSNVLLYKGIPVVRMTELSLALDRDFRITVGVYNADDDTTYYIPNVHRAVITTPDNLAIGVSGDQMLEDFRINYDLYANGIRMESSYDADTQILFKQMTGYLV